MGLPFGVRVASADHFLLVGGVPFLVVVAIWLMKHAQKVGICVTVLLMARESMRTTIVVGEGLTCHIASVVRTSWGCMAERFHRISVMNVGSMEKKSRRD